MSDEIGKYRIGPRDGVEVPYKVILECEALNGFNSYIDANNQRTVIARIHEIDHRLLEVKIRR